MATETRDGAPEDDAEHITPEESVDSDTDEPGEAWPPEVDVSAVSEELAAAEAFVEERVQRSLAPYRGTFPPEVIEAFAEELRCFLLTHPVASKMLGRIRPRAAPVVSGEREVLYAPAADEAKAPDKSRKGRG